jgi:hypothetical protein
VKLTTHLHLVPMLRKPRGIIIIIIIGGAVLSP